MSRGTVLNMKPAAIYRRISNDREGRELGVVRQEEDCRALADRLGFTVVDVYTDNDLGASTRSRKPRPEYRRMLADAREGKVRFVLAYTSGRLTRRPREHEDLIELAEQHGVRFHYVASPDFDLNTAAGRRVARILAANDAGEAEDIAERVIRAKAQAAADGVWKGGRRPYGYEDDGVTVRPAEADVVRHLTDQTLAGASLRGLAAELNDRGLVTSTGAPWRQDAVRRVLLRPRNAGLMEHRGEVLGAASWPALVPEDRWRAVVAAIQQPGRRTNWSSARRWLLSGIALCGVCGETCFVSQVGGGRGRRKLLPAYTCESRHVARIAVEVERLVEGAAVARLQRPDFAELVVINAGPATVDAHATALELRARLDSLAASYGDGDIDARQLKAGTTRLRARLKEAEGVMAKSAQGSVLTGMLGVENVELHWAGLDLDRRRAIIDSLMEVTIMRTAKGRPRGWMPGSSYFNPESVRIAWRPE